MYGIDTEQPYILEVPDILSKEECKSFIERLEKMTFETATINSGRGTHVNREVRNNERVIYDDHSFADLIIKRLGEHAPTTIHGMRLVGANEKLRCYRYKTGMKFKPHPDGAFQRNENEISCYSCLIYLNDGFIGGETTFLTEPEVVITPVAGSVLLFQHPIIHEGSEVRSGIKYVARTDLMYQTDKITSVNS